MATILYVRVKSDLDSEELERRVEERKPRFEEVPGLIQKIYGRDEATGDWCGIYFFESKQALAAFRDSELARTIPEAAIRFPCLAVLGFPSIFKPTI